MHITNFDPADTMNESSNESPYGPIPAAVGLLAGCVTTMIGIAIGCEPETILYRCVVSAIAVTLIATLVRTMWQMVDSASRP